MKTRTPDSLARAISRKRVLARAALRFERLWPAVWPSVGVAGAFLCLALLDVLPMLGPWLHLLVILAFLAAALGLLARGLRRLRPLAADAADRRLEQASGLKHRPLAALADRPSQPGAEALWQAHKARAAAQISRLRVGLPRPGLARSDRMALRGLLIVALAALLVIAGSDAFPRLGRAFHPGFPPGLPAPAPQLQAWVTPPAYTGIAPIFLKSDTGSLSVPVGSRFTASVTGGETRPVLSLAGHGTPFQALDRASFQVATTLTRSGMLSVQRGGSRMASWNLAVVPDQPPVVAFAAPPGRVPHTLQVRLPWRASDDYGVTKLQAELRLRDRPDAKPVIVPIPMATNAPKQAHGAAKLDLTANPWAGLPVTVRLLAQDALGQTGTSTTASLVLPQRSFHHPVARALVALRQFLALHPDDTSASIQVLDNLSNMPKALGGDLGAYINLRAIASLLSHGTAPQAVDQAQPRLWQLALHLEEGGASRTARALAAARQQLHDALDRQARGEKVDAREIDRLMQQLQKALAQHLQALAEQAKREGTPPAESQAARSLGSQDLERMAQQMRDAARQGNMEEARQRMQALEQMLNRLQAAKPARSNPKAAEQQRRARQQMSALQDLARRQAMLLDHAQQRAAQPSEDFPQAGARSLSSPEQDSAGQQSGESQQGQNGSGASAAQQRASDARVERALRRALGELMQQSGDLTGQVPGSLSDADKAMRDAGHALGEGHDQEASASEQHAIEALQKGAQQMRQQLAKMARDQQNQANGGQGDEDSLSLGEGQGKQGQGGDQEGPDGMPRHRNANLDPLGRSLHQGASGGTDDGSDVRVPDHMEQVRTRALQDELRRRGADLDRPKEELDYINRLLKQF